MNRKVKISIILSLIIAVLAAIFVIFCDPIEKIKWSIEQSKIEDKVIPDGMTSSVGVFAILIINRLHWKYLKHSTQWLILKQYQMKPIDINPKFV